MTDEPTLGENSRRIDELSRRTERWQRDILSRLNEMPTEKTMIGWLATRDLGISGLTTDVERLTAALGAERAARQAADLRIEEERKTDRRWAFGAIFTVAAFALPVVLVLARTMLPV